jgi:putative oxidoreductase
MGRDRPGQQAHTAHVKIVFLVPRINFANELFRGAKYYFVQAWSFRKQRSEQMTSANRGVLTVLGRVLLSLIFLMSAVGNKIPQFSKVADLMASEGVPAPNLMLSGAILFLIAGSLSIIFGYKARLGATLLLIFLVLATYFFHDFWTWPEDSMWVLSTNEDAKMLAQQNEMIALMKNLALMGAMLLIMANGSGPYSLDDYLKSRKAKGAVSETKQVVPEGKDDRD